MMIQCYEIKGYTDTEATVNRPDMKIKNKKEKTRILIDVAIPTDKNVMQKEAGKKLKYRSLYRRYVECGNELYDYTGNNWSQPE
jgi:transcription antitermination factor NusG